MKMASPKSLTDFFQPAKRHKLSSSTSSSPNPSTAPVAVACKSLPNHNASGNDSPPTLTPEKNFRIKVNHLLAKSKLNLKICSERVSESMTAGGKLGVLKLEELLVEETWLEALVGEFQKAYAQKLGEFVDGEVRGSCPIYPPLHLVFNALNSTPFDDVKVVIIGQDPYHGPGQAMGLSFSVPEGIKVPSSLVNIYKELKQDLNCSIPSHGNLERWAVQIKDVQSGSENNVSF